MSTRKEERAVVVYTDKKGVFFGFTDKPFDRHKMVLRECRMCVYWTRGVLRLASHGPGPDCRITPAVPEQVLVDLHGESLCTPEAVKAWREEPWG